MHRNNRVIDVAITEITKWCDLEKHVKHLLNEMMLAKAKELAEMIIEFCPASREQSVAFKNLETAVMWANAAIARNA